MCFTLQESTDEDIPMCVIGNKVDLRAERPEGSCVTAFHGEKLAMVSLVSFGMIEMSIMTVLIDAVYCCRHTMQCSVRQVPKREQML